MIYVGNYGEISNLLWREVCHVHISDGDRLTEGSDRQSRRGHSTPQRREGPVQHVSRII